MRSIAIIPIRSFGTGKARLSDHLTACQRHDLVQAMAGHVIQTVLEAGEFNAVAVLSADPEVLKFGQSKGATSLLEVGPGGLNMALEAARANQFCENANALFVIFSDLPHVTTQDICRMIAISRDGTPIVIAPDRHQTGTNALLLRPPTALPFSFGRGSFRHHVHEAERLGLAQSIYTAWGTAFDVDEPTDLEFIGCKSAASRKIHEGQTVSSEAS